MYARIIIDISHQKLDRAFTYRIPPELCDEVVPGMQVQIPFNGRVISGYVAELANESSYDESKIKDIISVCHEAVVVDARMIALAFWMKRHFGGTLNAALKTVIPVREKVDPVVRRFIKRAISPEELVIEMGEAAARKRPSAQKQRLMEALAEDEIIPWEIATGKLLVGSAAIRDLEKRGILTVEEETALRDPLKSIKEGKQPPVLNESQKAIVDSFLADHKAGIRRPALIRGVTGSGKTEVYMEIMAGVISLGKQVIFLIPEIALTFQTVMRLYGRFGDRISIINSKMSKGERHDQMERARLGEIDILIGPRSALFAPFLNLGLIVIDEEHETSYKSETVPKYHARETAQELARMTGAAVLLGSATPSVESYSRAVSGEYRLYELKERVSGRELPECEIVDLREELRAGNRSIISRRARRIMEETLSNGEQAMLFLNRRGIAGFVSCRSCGEVIKCPHCDVSLTEHFGERMICHYCGYTQKKPTTCPSCGSKYIGGFKAGTERVEQMIKEEFPSARILRMDADTTARKGQYEEILTRFRDGAADILIGTQMIVKGHDFPRVTFVGILAADMSLNAGDFRSSERTFQLLTQAAGRSGRGDKPGRVIIQTYQPGHYAIVLSGRQDYEGFFEREIAYRRLLGYPPAGHLLNLLLTSPDEAALGRAMARLSDEIKRIINKFSMRVNVMGPKDAVIAKLQDVYRKEVYFKGADMEVLVRLKDELEEAMMDDPLFRRVQSQFDLDM